MWVTLLRIHGYKQRQIYGLAKCHRITYSDSSLFLLLRSLNRGLAVMTFEQSIVEFIYSLVIIAIYKC